MILEALRYKCPRSPLSSFLTYTAIILVKNPEKLNKTRTNSMKLLDTFKIVSAAAPLAVRSKPAIHTPAPMLSPPFSTCEGFIQAVEGDTCNTLAPKAGSLDEFIRLNPGLHGGAGCESGNINPGYFYCVKPLPQAPDGRNKGSPPPGEQHRGDKIPEPTERPERPDPPAPEPTEGPKKKCQFGDCWKSWIAISTDDDENRLERAHRSCEKLATEPFFCTDHGKMDFPAPIKEGCDNCAELMSGCRCWLGGAYHTYTIGYVYGEWDDVADWVPNGKKRAE